MCTISEIRPREVTWLRWLHFLYQPLLLLRRYVVDMGTKLMQATMPSVIACTSARKATRACMRVCFRDVEVRP